MSDCCCCCVAERPLHPKEKVLEQALQWCHLREPSSAYLLVKKVPRGEGLSILTCRWRRRHRLTA